MIIVHGGAGAWKDERIPIGVEYVKKAARVGYDILAEGGNALDAAEICTAFMEDCGRLNAGLGATKNSDDQRELDAMIVDGSTLNFGSVGGLTEVQNPIYLARYVLEKTEYCFFAGDNALKLYKKMLDEGYRVEKAVEPNGPPADTGGKDTVGCIVIDSEGRIVSTSSTGGIKNKTPGRVGDSPVIGSGAYATAEYGVSATGMGEHIMRVTLSRLVVFHLEQGHSIEESLEKSMRTFDEKTNSEAGLIAIDRFGNWGKLTNCKAMPTAVFTPDLNEPLSFQK